MTEAGGGPPLEVSVSIATAADIDALVPLYRGFMLHEHAQPPDAPELSRRISRLLASDADEILIARDAGNAAIGYLQQRYFLSVWRPDIDAYIEDVFVDEHARGRRVGERLVEAALASARKRGALRICLDCNEGNLRARKLYERLGFANENRAWSGARQLYYSRLL
jgi:ribosomal protein S18 acetylase RimI-like enzyme